MVLRCLIVDDSPVFLKAARALLEREGISVTVALNSAEAFRLFDEVCPDVVLLDIDFGDESGFDLAQTLSRRARPAGGPGEPQLILISNHSRDDLEELIEDSPVRGFIDKAALSTSAIRLLLSGLS